MFGQGPSRELLCPFRVSGARFSIVHSHTHTRTRARAHPQPWLLWLWWCVSISVYGEPGGEVLSLKGEVLRFRGRDKQRFCSRACEGGTLARGLPGMHVWSWGLVGGGQGRGSSKVRGLSALTTRLKYGFTNWCGVWHHGEPTLGVLASLLVNL